MKVNAYLNFNGDCAAALEFYQKHLGASVDSIFRGKDAPASAQMGAEWDDKIIHARFTIGNDVLMASDCPSEYYAKPQGTTISLHVESQAEAERIFGALAEGGTVIMPLEQTFWATRFGMVTDQFGTPWMINFE
jgi:PhnB protein